MPKLNVITECTVHIKDVATMELECFHTATWHLLEILRVEAEIDEIPALLREWLDGEDSELIELEFEDSYGQMMAVVYNAD